MQLNEKLVNKFKEIIERYPDKNASLLQLLHLVQKEFGFISEENEKEIADFLNISPARVHEVVTFYTMYNKHQIGKYHIQVCENITCSLLGAEHLIKYLEKKLNVKVGETTEDRKWTLSTVECLGSCGTAPVMMINEVYYEGLDENKLDKILDGLK